MLIKSNEQLPLARLFQFIELGEQVAHDCAKSQAPLAPEPGMRQFLQGQSRQEGQHAFAFQTAITWLAPGHLGSSPFWKPFKNYRRLIESALRRGDFYETLLAEQGILEGLGEVTLKKLELGLVKRQAPFQRLRHVLLQQEAAHHDFGHRMLHRAVRRGEMREDNIQHRAAECLVLAESMITTGQELLEEMDEDPEWYLAQFRNSLLDWVQDVSSPGASVSPNFHEELSWRHLLHALST